MTQRGGYVRYFCRPLAPFRPRCQRCVVGLVTGGGSQLPLPWSKGAPCFWADAGAGAAPARTAAIVSMIDSLVTTNSCLRQH